MIGSGELAQEVADTVAAHDLTSRVTIHPSDVALALHVGPSTSWS